MPIKTVLQERDESTTDCPPPSDGPDADGTSVEQPTIQLPIDTAIQLSAPPTASSAETAALASCLGAHLRNEQLATQAVSQSKCVGGWSLAGQYGCRSSADLPRLIKRGEEWKMVARVGRGR